MTGVQTCALPIWPGGGRWGREVERLEVRLDDGRVLERDARGLGFARGFDLRRGGSRVSTCYNEQVVSERASA